MKTLLITGINGYLGSTLAKRYANDYNVIGLEYSTEDLFRLKNHSFLVFASKNGIPDKLFKKSKIDIIIHTATFYGRKNESNIQMTYANMYLPQMLLEKAINHGCKLFINTDTVLDRFTSSYALTKSQFGDWLSFYTQNQKIQVINLQLEHFYGPGAMSTNFITLMVQKMLKNEPVISLTKAEQNRDFLYIDDLLRVYDLMLEKANILTNYEQINVGAGINTNLKYILEYIKKKSSSVSNLDFGIIPYRENELMESNNDISKLNKLGWKVNYTIEQGLDMVISYEKNKIVNAI
tara:strand:- start:53 stop:931 length:879 start_codon:yes stop_codon:yes gene_type:complete